MTELEQAIKAAVKAKFGEDMAPELSRPDEAFGDFSTNVALRLAAKVGHSPQAIADELVADLKPLDIIDDAVVAGPGFINFRLINQVLVGELAKVNADYGQNQKYMGKVVVAEYSDPNPFKVLHAGHLYTSVVGDALANLYEAGGAEVHRVNFGGDVGRHVAITMWAIIKRLSGELPEKLADIDRSQQAEWLSEAYVEGNNAFQDSEPIRAEILELNKRLYQIHDEDDRTSPLAQIYWTTRKWSYDYFEDFYRRLGIKFERYYPESEVAPLGVKTVKEQLGKGVFKESDGAIVFAGEEFDLHTRVFINSEGLPTYEAKDVGLILQKWQDYKFDVSLVITANEIAQYMQVVLKALEQFEPDLAQKTVHLTHGMVRLKGGVKMSSRAGNILKATDVLEAAGQAATAINNTTKPEVVLGAVKYAFLRQGIGGDIIYDPEESVALQGNSGPYLQYAYVRAQSILRKASGSVGPLTDLEPSERGLALAISRFPEVVAKAQDEHVPQHISTYLYDLAQKFNQFYELQRVIGDPREGARLALVKAYGQVLKNGLELFNIPVPESM